MPMIFLPRIVLKISSFLDFITFALFFILLLRSWDRVCLLRAFEAHGTLYDINELLPLDGTVVPFIFGSLILLVCSGIVVRFFVYLAVVFLSVSPL